MMAFEFLTHSKNDCSDECAIAHGAYGDERERPVCAQHKSQLPVIDMQPVELYTATGFGRKTSRSAMKTNELTRLLGGRLEADERAVRKTASMPDSMGACECVRFVLCFRSDQRNDPKPHKLAARVEQTKSSPRLARCILLYE